MTAPSTHRSQKGMLDLLKLSDGREPPRRCWELNPAPLQEQVLLTAELSPTALSKLISKLKCNSAYHASLLPSHQPVLLC